MRWRYSLPPISSLGVHDHRLYVGAIEGLFSLGKDDLRREGDKDVRAIASMAGEAWFGAYGAVQSGFYNTRALVPEVLVKDDQYAVVRPRIEVDELIAMDRPAPWL